MSFFDERTDSSEVKSKIVSDYFGAWTTIMKSKANSDRLAYIDLFCGPGRYNDGSKSTPLTVLEKIINDPNLCNKMVTIFNDANSSFCNNLENEIKKIPGYEQLKYEPIILNTVVGDDFLKFFEETSLVPTLGFVDPWGYKGLSSRLIGSLIKDWGSDCIFYFNYNRINMGITNPVVVEHMNSIFGQERADNLRETVRDLPPQEREETILNELAESLTCNRSNYVLPFRFINASGVRTSHYLILVCKHVLGYTIMKDIMYRYSSEHIDGVASFSYIPVINRQLSLLSLYDRPLDSLGNELLDVFKGETLSVKDIFNRHQVGTPFVLSNYKEALRRLEYEEKIKCNPSKRRVIKGVKSMADKTKITFP